MRADIVLSERASGRYPRAQVTRHPDLPYGVWTCLDGREVLFDRRYRPLWERQKGSPPRRADATEWVAHIVGQQFFYDYGTPKAARRSAALAALAAWGIAP